MPNIKPVVTAGYLFSVHLVTTRGYLASAPAKWGFLRAMPVSRVMPSKPRMMPVNKVMSNE